MAFLHMERMSAELQITTPVNLIVPDRLEEGKKYPVLWLLHGATLNYSDWMRMTSIERYAARYKLVVVMPDGGDSAYCDMAMGGRMANYQTYIADELRDYITKLLPVSDRREDNFIAGFSMGGQGAARMALVRPELYSRAGVFSAGNYMDYHEKDSGNLAIVQRYNKMFGESEVDKLRGTPADLEFLAEETVNAGVTLPEFYLTCGTEDNLFPMAVKFRDFMTEKGYLCDWHEGSGAHTFEFWDEWTPPFLEWLPIEHI